MGEQERAALDRVLAAISAVSSGAVLESSLEAVCEAARSLGARDAWVEFRDADGGPERVAGGRPGPDAPGAPEGALVFQVGTEDAEGRFVVTGLISEAIDLVGRLTPVVAVALQADRFREAIRRTAMRDPLTGLVNRLGLDDLLRRDVERAHRSGAPISIVVMDLDRLDRINETFGRLTGDAVIVAMADVLRGGLRLVDIAARIGGGEFCALLPGAGTENAREVAERLRCAVAVATVANVGALTATFGVAALHEHAANGIALLQAAQAAMTTGKRRGRNRVDVAVPLNRV